MPNVKGVVLTDRDRVLLSYVGIARYASADQIHKLLFDGRSKKQTYRRLAKLCVPGGRPGEGACLRRLEFRRREGTGVPVWALTPFGRTVVVPLVPWLSPPAAADVGARFLEHTLVLNDVLLGLVLALRAAAWAPLAALPFRWHAEGDDVLEYEIFRSHLGSPTRALLKPDAILEIQRRQRRLFIEAETGTQSITTANPGQTGAVVSKLRRYTRFFEGLARPRAEGTWYEAAFPDRFVPRLVFLVHSTERRERVRRAVEAELKQTQPTMFQVLVYTFAEAAGVLAPYIVQGRLGSELRNAARLVAVDDQKARQAREGFNELTTALEAAREALRRHNATAGASQLALPSLRMDVVRALRDFLERDVLGGRGAADGTDR